MGTLTGYAAAFYQNITAPVGSKAVVGVKAWALLSTLALRTVVVCLLRSVVADSAAYKTADQGVIACGNHSTKAVPVSTKSTMLLFVH